MNRHSKEQYLFKIETFCNIANVFTVTFYYFNAPLQNSKLLISLVA